MTQYISLGRQLLTGWRERNRNNIQKQKPQTQLQITSPLIKPSPSSEVVCEGLATLPSCSHPSPRGRLLLSGQVLGTEPSLAFQPAPWRWAVRTPSHRASPLTLPETLPTGSSRGTLSRGDPETRLRSPAGPAQEERGASPSLSPRLQLLGCRQGITRHRRFEQVFHNINLTFVTMSTFWQVCCYQQHSKYRTRWQ